MILGLKSLNFLSPCMTLQSGQVPIAPAESILATLKAIAENLDHEFTAYGRTFRIPVDFKIGLAWGDLIEVKLTTDSVTAALKELGYEAA